MTEITEENFSDEIAPFLVHHTDAHTEVQIDFFVIGNSGEGHPWGMYRQAMRELASRESQLVGAIHSRKGLLLDLRAHDADLKDDAGAPENDTARYDIWIERIWLERGLVERKIAADDDRIERIVFEGRRILKRTRELQEKLVAEHGELTPEVLRRLDEEFWVHSFRQRIALTQMAHAPLPQDVVKVLPLLPARMRDPIVLALGDPGKNMGSFGFFEAPRVRLKGIG